MKKKKKASRKGAKAQRTAGYSDAEGKLRNAWLRLVPTQRELLESNGIDTTELMHALHNWPMRESMLPLQKADQNLRTLVSLKVLDRYPLPQDKILPDVRPDADDLTSLILVCFQNLQHDEPNALSPKTVETQASNRRALGAAKKC